ncbi:MAG TPA: hypothetical protein DD412_06035 [Holosporales bacterium]|nr:hypothetical protein [Holosporales bacterium]
MAKVTYKKISDHVDELVSPINIEKTARGSVYSNSAELLEHYSLDVLSLIPFKNQARKNFSDDHINELSASISTHGIRQPLTVIRSQSTTGKYEVVSGERRLIAAKKAGLKKVPCIIIHDYDDAEEIALIENIQREDLHPIEIGMALKNILDFNSTYNQASLAKKLGVTKQYVSDSISYNSIPDDVKEYLLKNNILSRSLLRKILKSDNPSKFIKNDSIKTVATTRSLLRVSLLDDDYNFQYKGLRELPVESLEKIKGDIDILIDRIIKEKSAAADK